MRITVIDDYQDAFRSLAASDKLKGHDVKVLHAPDRSELDLIGMLEGAEAVLPRQQRTALPRGVIGALPALEMVGEPGRNAAHIDLAACKERGIVVSAGGSGTPNATAELA